MSRITVIGFPKCGTMSMVEWLRVRNPKAEISRPENIYIEDKVDWSKWECVAITRDPMKRLQSGHGYFTQLRGLDVNDLLKGYGKGYRNVGFENPIEQSDYDRYIARFEHKHGVKVKVYRFEDMIKDSDFPHINDTQYKKIWNEKEKKLVKSQLEKHGIVY